MLRKRRYLLIAGLVLLALAMAVFALRAFGLPSKAPAGSGLRFILDGMARNV